MKRLFSYIFVFLLALVAYFCIDFFYFTDKKTNESYDARIIAHEIKKLNKMIVVEQNFSEFITHKNSALGDNIIGNFFEIDDKKMVLHVKTKVQAVYDMKKLIIETDSIDKEIIIKQIPDVELQIFPDVEIFSLTQGLVNNYSEKEIKKITENSKKNRVTKDQETIIKQDAEKQFLENLNGLWFLANTYNWKVINQTNRNLKY